jgi:hypothetical protein
MTLSFPWCLLDRLATESVLEYQFIPHCLLIMYRLDFLPLLFTLLLLTRAFASPDYSILLARQEPGTPQYDCHADCGAVITIGRTPDHCANATFTASLEDCLNCALEFDIWRYYGESVGEAATACGLATPAAANATASGSSSAGSITGSVSVTAIDASEITSGASTAASGGAVSASISSDLSSVSATASEVSTDRMTLTEAYVDTYRLCPAQVLPQARRRHRQHRTLRSGLGSLQLLDSVGSLRGCSCRHKVEAKVTGRKRQKRSRRNSIPVTPPTSALALKP